MTLASLSCSTARTASFRRVVALSCVPSFSARLLSTDVSVTPRPRRYWNVTCHPPGADPLMSGGDPSAASEGGTPGTPVSIVMDAPRTLQKRTGGPLRASLSASLATRRRCAGGRSAL